MIDIDIKKSLYSASGEMDLEIKTTIKEGEFVSLFGVSGAGKTTLLRIISGLESPESGRLIVDGEVWFDKDRKIDLPPQKRSVGFVFQDFALFPNMKVRDNLLYALKKGDDKEYVESIMETVGLSELAERYPSQLSGGQKQRVALARALVMRPKILLLDEPLSALDRAMRSKLQDELMSIHKLFKITTILVSHDSSEIFKLCSRVVWIEEGSLKSQGKPSEIFIKDNAGATFEFIGELLEITKNEMVYVLVLHVGQDIIKTIATRSEVENLRIGDRVRVIAKSFHPIIEKIDL
jgi:molybdate transport system ATP-binding protein